MSNRNQNSSQIHKSMISSLASRYENEYSYVKADHISHPNGRPSNISGHIPDIAAYYNGSIQIIAEAETCDSISDSDTYSQWLSFSQSRYNFHVIVPKSCLGKAKEQALRWGITVDQWWWHGN